MDTKLFWLTVFGFSCWLVLVGLSEVVGPSAAGLGGKPSCRPISGWLGKPSCPQGVALLEDAESSTAAIRLCLVQGMLDDLHTFQRGRWIVDTRGWR